MLSVEKINPLLLIGFDEVDNELQELVDALANSNPDVSQLEIIERANQKQIKENSDIIKKQIRVPIPIADVIGIQHTGSTSQTRKDVFYDNNDVVLSNYTNNVTIKLEMKSALSTLSSSVDLFYAIADKNFTRFKTDPRASFFSPNFCFFNGYLTGITRTGSANSDKETLLLNFERGVNNPDTEPEEASKASDTPTTKPLPDSTGGINV